MAKMDHDIGDFPDLTFIQTFERNSYIIIFCDSSQLAHGAVAYLRVQEDNEINTAFIMTNTKVAPVRKHRRYHELNAAHLGSKLSVCEYLSKTLQLINTKYDIIYWRDSQIIIFVIV